ncbi:MAG TPA: hypothetical protein VKZ85_09895 [Woeseiaceae bacterium]|nr:hypothetical protein [Woeseiaceae bacterium]
MHRRLVAVTALALVLVQAGCGDNATGGKPFPTSDELMAADRAFAKASAERGAAAWAEVWSERGLLYGDGANPAVGPVAASRSIAGIVDELRWEPTTSGMLWPGVLGYTVGDWWLASDEAERERESRRYLTVWQRMHGAWKVVLDLSLPEQKTTSAARAFDFWLGDWKLEQRIWSGRGDDFEPYPAENQVRLIEGGALVERLEGHARFFWLGMEEPAPMRGVSVRVYYPEERHWRIFWMHTLDPKFGPPYTGGFAGDVGEFVLTERPAGIPPSRMRFERRKDGTVDWQLALRTPDGENWQPLWLIDFRPHD